MESGNDLNTLAAVVIIGLAVWQTVEVWHHSTLTAGWRVRVASWSWPDGAGFWGWLDTLLGCPWCTSVWAAFVLTTFYYAGSVFWLFVVALAVSRVANALNDYGHDWCRTPKTNTLPIESTAAPGPTVESRNQNLEVQP